MKKIVAFLMTFIMILGAISGMAYTAVAAETEVNIAPDAVTMIKGKDGGYCMTEMVDGLAGTSSDYYWTLGNWSEEDVADENGIMIGDPTPIADSVCYVEADLGALYDISSISAATLVSDRIYKWEAYATDDNTKPISEWTKVAEMKDDVPSIEAGYKVALEKEVSARYVRLYGVYNSSNRGFHLCEFGIWSKKEITPVVCDEPTNLALNSTIRKSDRDVTTELIDGEAGETSYYYWSTYGSCVKDPIANDSGAWFEVDLGGYYDVDAINVIPRVGDHYYHWEVYATCNNAEPMTSWEKVAEKATDDAASIEGFTAAVKEGTVARYLRVYGTYTSDPDYSTAFQVCEIEVWAGLDPTVEFEGYQLGNDGSSIRLIGSVDDIDLDSVDFEVTVTNVEGKTFSNSTSNVYKTFTGTVNGETVNVVTTADSGEKADWTIDADYLYGYAIISIPAGTYTFAVTPVSVDAEGNTVRGMTYTFTVTLG